MSKDFQLRPFQETVFQHVMNGRSVILQAPTGSGKTKAALMPFLQNLAQHGNALPLTCRYAVPLRVLANQFFREYESIAARIDRLFIAMPYPFKQVSSQMIHKWKPP